jgi:hypothetical protein
VQDLWASLSTPGTTSAQARARLEQLFFTGLPGFEPVVHVNHYGAVGGQVRTNQFMSGAAGTQLWMLKESKLAKTCPAGLPCRLEIVPVTTKTNPAPQLFSDASIDPRKAAFQSAFVDMVPTLAQGGLTTFGMTVPDTFNSGQSHSESLDTGLSSPTITNDYRALFSPGGAFAAAIQTKLNGIGSTLTPTQIVERATTQSCGGCHHHSAERSLGGGLVWPSTLGFVHVSENGTEQGGFGPAFPISPALKEVFLPHRRNVVASFLAKPPVVCGPPPLLVNQPIVISKEALVSSAPLKMIIGGQRTVH